MNTKAEIVEAVIAEHDLTKKEAQAIVETIFGGIKNHLASGKDCSIAGFGSFKVKEKAARSGTAPDGSTWTKPAHNAVSFKPASVLKEAVAKS